MSEIKVSRHIVFDGNTGWQHNGYTYRLVVGVEVLEAPNGDLICGWMTGANGEPEDDHAYVISRSTDRGRTWSEPQILQGNDEGNGAAKLQQVGDRLFAICSTWTDNYLQWKHVRMESHDNGVTWGDAIPVTLYEGEGLSSSFGNLIRTASGELLGCGTFMEKRPVPLTASVERLALAKSEEEALAMEPIKEGETPVNNMGYDTTLLGLFCYEANEDLTEFKIRGRVDNRPLGLLEGNIVELEPGHLVFLTRAEWAGFLWRSDSYDGGFTWSEAAPTDIPNPSTMAQIIKLPDGRIVLINNPTGGVVGQRGPRDPMAVWVSSDGMKTWDIQQDVISGGYLCYPGPFVLRDGTIGFTYDRDRRFAEYVELEIPR